MNKNLLINLKICFYHRLLHLKLQFLLKQLMYHNHQLKLLMKLIPDDEVDEEVDDVDDVVSDDDAESCDDGLLHS